jgi:hypothetical protein
MVGDTAERGTALAVTTGGPFQFGALDQQLFSTYPKDQGAKVVALMQGKFPALADQAGQEILVEHVLAHGVETVDEDGVVKAFLRIVLVSPDGTAYQTTSEGIRNSIRLLAKFYGLPPWKEPLKLKVQKIRTARQRVTYYLEPVA